jgi:hypothetical protein
MYSPFRHTWSFGGKAIFLRWLMKFASSILVATSIASIHAFLMPNPALRHSSYASVIRPQTWWRLQSPGLWDKKYTYLCLCLIHILFPVLHLLKKNSSAANKGLFVSIGRQYLEFGERVPWVVEMDLLSHQIACSWSCRVELLPRASIKLFTVSTSSTAPDSNPQESWNTNCGLLRNTSWFWILCSPHYMIIRWLFVFIIRMECDLCRRLDDGSINLTENEGRFIELAVRQMHLEPSFQTDHRPQDPRQSRKLSLGSLSFQHRFYQSRECETVCIYSEYRSRPFSRAVWLPKQLEESSGDQCQALTEERGSKRSIIDKLPSRTRKSAWAWERLYPPKLYWPKRCVYYVTRMIARLSPFQWVTEAHRFTSTLVGAPDYYFDFIVNSKVFQ